jgi:hypothetical protein
MDYLSPFPYLSSHAHSPPKIVPQFYLDHLARSPLPPQPSRTVCQSTGAHQVENARISDRNTYVQQKELLKIVKNRPEHWGATIQRANTDKIRTIAPLAIANEY